MAGKRSLSIFILMIVMSVLFAGCDEPSDSARSDTGKEVTVSQYVPKTGTYDSFDTAVIAHISKNAKEVTFYNYSLGRLYTLSYTGATVLRDRFGIALSMAQLNVGDMVDKILEKI